MVLIERCLALGPPDGLKPSGRLGCVRSMVGTINDRVTAPDVAASELESRRATIVDLSQ